MPLSKPPSPQRLLQRLDSPCLTHCLPSPSPPQVFVLRRDPLVALWPSPRTSVETPIFKPQLFKLPQAICSGRCSGSRVAATALSRHFLCRPSLRAGSIAAFLSRLASTSPGDLRARCRSTSCHRCLALQVASTPAQSPLRPWFCPARGPPWPLLPYSPL